MDLAQQLFRQVFFVVVDLSGQTDISVSFSIDGLVGASDKVLCFVGDGCCCLGQTKIVTLVVILLLHEGQSLEVAGSVD
jgi:hypothetical protein